MDGRSMFPSPTFRSGMSVSLTHNALGMQKVTRAQIIPAGKEASPHRARRTLQIGGQFLSDNTKAILVRLS